MEIDFMTFYYHKYDVKLYIMYSASIFTQEIVTTKRALRQQFSHTNPKWKKFVPDKVHQIK